MIEQAVSVVSTEPEDALHEMGKRTTALAMQLGYEGSLSIGALEDGIRFYQQRTVEACLELGKHLLILKEMTPHGEFKQRTEMLNINERTARRFMSAALKFNKTDNLSVLKAAGNQSKLLELLVLDDEEITELSNGGSVNDITLDEIDRLTASELRKKLREAKADAEAKDSIIRKKDESLNKLDTEINILKSPMEIKLREQSEAQLLQTQAIQLMQKSVLTFLDAVSTFNSGMNAALESCNDIYVQEQYQANIRMTYQSIVARCNEANLPIDFAQMVTPDWLAEAMNADVATTVESEA